MRCGLRIADGLLTIWGIHNGLSETRLGLTVGRRYGGAVQRNRAKRVLREAFRLSRHDLPPGLDLVVSPGFGQRVTLSGTIESLRRLSARLARRLCNRGASASDVDSGRAEA
jgi:ribonuclease P protein component